MKPLGLTCVLLLVGGMAGAQKKIAVRDPYANMPALPAPKLLSSTSAPAPSISATSAPAVSTPAPTTQPITSGPAPVAEPPSALPSTDLAPSWVPGQPIPGTAAAPATSAAPDPSSAPDTPVSTYAPSTGRAHSILSFDEYEHLLNVVLPLDHRSPPGLEYSLILRFEPHVHPESQIVIRHWRDGTTETAVYRVDKVNAWRAAYGNVAEGQTPDFVAMSKEIKIVRNSFYLQPSEEADWRKALLPALQKELSKARKKSKHRDKDGVHELEINGTRYELWYIQGDSEMHFVSLDSEVDSMTHGSEELTRWMNDVRSYANGHLTTYKPLRNSADEMKLPRTLLSAK